MTWSVRQEEDWSGVAGRVGKNTAKIGWVLLTGVVIAVIVFAVAVDPRLIRVIVAVVITLGLVLVSLRKPQAAVLLALCLLPGLALVRRMLIPVAGWTTYDGLLLIAPILSIVVFHRLFIMERRPIAKDALSKLVVALFSLTLLETLNPDGGGLLAGMTGLLFMASPLVWFFIGREIADRRLVSTLVACTALSGAVIAAYGLLQQQVGFPSWDASWIAINGYTALSVDRVTRAFGTLSSSAEYATFVAAALILTIVSIRFGRRRWLLALPIVPLLATALFFDSSRGIVILMLLAIVVVLGLRTGNLALTGLLVVAAAVGAWGTVQFFGPSLTQMAQGSGNPLIAHQVGGLMNPFDPGQSTYLVHQQGALGGLVSGVQHPLGFGTAATNLAGERLATLTAGTEVDLTNAFVGLGLPGGMVYLALLIVTLCRAGSLALSNRDTVALATVGVLIVMLGQWLNGGYYALAPFVWLLVGAMNREWLARKAARETARRTARWNLPGTEEREALAVGW
jgi:hypothetical protein